MSKRDAFEVLRYFDRLDEDELIALPYTEIDRYARAIEVAFDGVCGRPTQPDEPARSWDYDAERRRDRKLDDGDACNKDSRHFPAGVVACLVDVNER